jgi:glucose-1-phosphate thymidylyltransferase
MKAIILAGGKGTRLYPLTKNTSKHLLPIGGKPLIVRVLEKLKSSGVDKTILLIDHLHANQYLKTLRDGSQLGLLNLVYIWQSSKGLGIPTAIKQTEELINKDDKFLVVCGDVLIDAGLDDFIDSFNHQDSGARILSTYVKDSAGFSLLRTKGNRILKIMNKNPKEHKPGYIDLGIYMFHFDVFKKIAKLSPSLRNETEIWDLNNLYIKENNLYMTPVEGWWCDVGRDIDTYLEANQRYEK